MKDFYIEEFKAMENIIEGMLHLNYFNITSLSHLFTNIRDNKRLSNRMQSLHI